MAIRHIYADYHVPIMPRAITWQGIHFFYDALIPGLIEIQKNERDNKKHGK
jgi:hypothetical protein